MIKKLLFGVAKSTPFERLINGLESTYDSRHDLLRVLTYHRVEEISDNPELYPELISATPHGFANQMNFLAKNYNVISIETLLNSLSSHSPLPNRSVLITFDDAYCSFQDHAWPILKKLSLPVSLFVATAYPGHPDRMFWWDRLFMAITSYNKNAPLLTPAGNFSLHEKKNRMQAFTRLKNHIKELPHQQAMALIEEICSQSPRIKPFQTVLDWDVLRRLEKEGVTIGAHTKFHPLMNRIDTHEAVNEAVESQHDIEREIGTALPIFAYPSGGFTKEVSRALSESGFEVAFTTMRGLNDLRTADLLLLRRINMGKNTPLNLLRAQLLQWNNIPGLLPIRA